MLFIFSNNSETKLQNFLGMDGSHQVINIYLYKRICNNYTFDFLKSDCKALLAIEITIFYNDVYLYLHELICQNMKPEHLHLNILLKISQFMTNFA